MLSLEGDGAAVVGRMVLSLIEVAATAALPPPPPPLAKSALKLAVVGRPFAGKSLVAQQLAEALSLRVVMAHEVVHAAVAAASRADEVEGEEPSAGAKAAQLLREGQPISDDLMVTLVADAMRAVDPVSYAGVVLDGFPRTAAQAKALEAALTGYAPTRRRRRSLAPRASRRRPRATRPRRPRWRTRRVSTSSSASTLTTRRRGSARSAAASTRRRAWCTTSSSSRRRPTRANDRLVPLAGASNQEAQLQPALQAYADGEGALNEWFDHLGLLSPVAAGGPLAEVGEAALAAATQIRTAKAEEAAKEEAEAEAAKAAEEAAAAEAAAKAEAEAAAAAEAEAARAAAEAAGEEPPPPPEGEGEGGGEEAAAEAPAPIVAAAAADLSADGASLLLGHWRTLEKEFVGRAAAALGTVRLLQWKGVQRQSGARKDLLELLQAADPRQSEVVEAQAAFNSMPTALRMEAAGKGELHALVEALLEKLWGHSDSKREAAEALLAAMKADEWQEQQTHRLVLALVDLAQAEVDRFAATCSVAADYCALRAEARVPPPPPGTLRLSPSPSRSPPPSRRARRRRSSSR